MFFRSSHQRAAKHSGRRWIRVLLALLGVVSWLTSPGCVGLLLAEDSGGSSWELRLVSVLEGFGEPECVCVDPATGAAYVSNVVSPKYQADKVNAADGAGFISRLAPGGKLDALHWIDSTPQAPLNSLKGMCILNGVLYGADIARVVRYDIVTHKALPPINIPAAVRLNDMASDGRCVYVSDTGGHKIYRLDGEQVSEFAPLDGANGITVADGRFYAVSTTQHDLYEINPRGGGKPRAFGLAKHFTGLDGIETLPDGSWIVSDVRGHKVCHVAADRKTVRVLAELQYAADIGLDRQRNLLMVPLFWDSRVMVYQLHPSGSTTTR